MTLRVPASMAAACLLLLLRPAPSLGVEAGVSYLVLPGTIEFARFDYESLQLTPQNTARTFGSVGVRVLADLPARIGPLGAALETGFSVPAGSQSFDHREMAIYPASQAPLLSHAQKHDGELTEASTAVLPVLLLLRTGGPSSGVTFTGEVGAGTLVIGLSTERTQTTWDSATDTRVISKLVSTDQRVVLGFAAVAGLGISVPATDAADLKVTAGILWLGDIPMRTVIERPPDPTIISGSGGPPYEPSLTLGGLGFTVRLGLSVNL